MSNEATDDVQQHDPVETSPEASEGAEGAVQTAQDAQPDAGATPQGDGKSDQAEHPLEPGGKRFNQVYARAKDAELKLQATREQLARLEGEVEVLRKPPTPPAPTPARYTGAQLQALVDEGKATVGQVLDYQAETLRMELNRNLEAKLEEKLVSSTRTSTVQRELNEYKHLVPDALQVGTPSNQKLLNEFSYLVSLGYDKNDPRTEVLAARAAFGDVDGLKQKRAAATITTNRDTMQDITQPSNPKPDDKKDILKQLSAPRKQHYQRMIDRGVYAGWKEVREELEEFPPAHL